MGKTNRRGRSEPGEAVIKAEITTPAVQAFEINRPPVTSSLRVWSRLAALALAPPEQCVRHFRTF
jgi:hypothetical protein